MTAAPGRVVPVRAEYPASRRAPLVVLVRRQRVHDGVQQLTGKIRRTGELFLGVVGTRRPEHVDSNFSLPGGPRPGRLRRFQP